MPSGGSGIASFKTCLPQDDASCAPLLNRVATQMQAWCDFNSDEPRSSNDVMNEQNEEMTLHWSFGSERQSSAGVNSGAQCMHLALESRSTTVHHPTTGSPTFTSRNPRFHLYVSFLL